MSAWEGECGNSFSIALHSLTLPGPGGESKEGVVFPPLGCNAYLTITPFFGYLGAVFGGFSAVAALHSVLCIQPVFKGLYGILPV